MIFDYCGYYILAFTFQISSLSDGESSSDASQKLGDEPGSKGKGVRLPGKSKARSVKRLVYYQTCIRLTGEKMNFFVRWIKTFVFSGMYVCLIMCA